MVKWDKNSLLIRKNWKTKFVNYCLVKAGEVPDSIYQHQLDVATNINITLNDGTTSKSIFFFTGASGATATSSMINFDFMVFVPAGHSVIISTSSSLNSVNGSYRQIANIDGELVNPI